MADHLQSLREHSEANIAAGTTAKVDGMIASVRSGSVEDPRLNNGKPTLIPFLWDGKVLSPREATDRAVASGVKWPEFNTNEEATVASKQISSTLGIKQVDPEIQKLVEKVIEAANGKPLKISITEQRAKQEQLEQIIRQLATSGALQQQSPGVQSPTSNGGQTTGQVSKTKGGTGSGVSESAPAVTVEDLAGIQKSIEKLSSDLAQVPK